MQRNMSLHIDYVTTAAYNEHPLPRFLLQFTRLCQHNVFMHSTNDIPCRLFFSITDLLTYDIVIFGNHTIITVKNRICYLVLCIADDTVCENNKI